MSDGQMLDMHDGRSLALVIAHAYPCGYIELVSEDSIWVPRDARGRDWTKRRCAAVLRQLVAFGCCSLHQGPTGTLVRVTETGYRMLDIEGMPAIRDADAERRLGPEK